MSRVTLSDVCEIIQGGRQKQTSEHFTETGFPAYGAGGLSGRLPKYEYNRSAVILSSIGARCGKCFFVDGPWVSLANTQLILPEPNHVDARFLWYQLNDEARWPRSGTAQPFIKPSDVKKSSVFLPPLDEQRRIAAILDQADTLRRKRREALARLKSLVTTTFCSMFESSSSTTQWPVKELREVVRSGTIITYGMVQAGEEFDGGVPYIRTGDIVDGEILSGQLRLADPTIAARFSRARVQADDIVMSIRATVGTTAMVPEHLDGANLTQGTARISPGELTNSLYLLQFLRSVETQRWIQNQVKGATFREITLHRLRELPVILPPIASQEAFFQKAQEIGKGERRLAAHAAQLDILFASLHHRAFRGEL